MYQKSLALVMVFTVIVLGCSPTHREGGGRADLGAKKVSLKQVLSSPERIEFSHVMDFVVKENCLSCHSSSRLEGGVDLSSYSLVINSKKKILHPYDPQLSSFYSTLITHGKMKMPPVGSSSLNEEQIELVRLWVVHGAVEKAETKLKPPLTLKEQLQPYFESPQTIDYEVVKDYVLQPLCMDCHSANGSKRNDNARFYSADLTSYESLFNPFVLTIKKGLPEESRLFRSMSITQSMPPAEDGYDPVPSLLTKLVRLWILNCAIEHFDPDGEEDLLDGGKTPSKRRKCEIN